MIDRANAEPRLLSLRPGADMCLACRCRRPARESDGLDRNAFPSGKRGIAIDAIGVTATVHHGLHDTVPGTRKTNMFRNPKLSIKKTPLAEKPVFESVPALRSGAASVFHSCRCKAAFLSTLFFYSFSTIA